MNALTELASVERMEGYRNEAILARFSQACTETFGKQAARRTKLSEEAAMIGAGIAGIGLSAAADFFIHNTQLGNAGEVVAAGAGAKIAAQTFPIFARGEEATQMKKTADQIAFFAGMTAFTALINTTTHNHVIVAGSNLVDEGVFIGACISKKAGSLLKDAVYSFSKNRNELTTVLAREGVIFGF